VITRHKKDENDEDEDDEDEDLSENTHLRRYIVDPYRWIQEVTSF